MAACRWVSGDVLVVATIIKRISANLDYEPERDSPSLILSFLRVKLRENVLLIYVKLVTRIS